MSLTATQVAKCQSTILAEAGFPHDHRGLNMGQAWIIVAFLEETGKNNRAAMDMMLCVAEVEELDKPLEGADLEVAAKEVLGVRE